MGDGTRVPEYKRLTLHANAAFMEAIRLNRPGTREAWLAAWRAVDIAEHYENAINQVAVWGDRTGQEG